MSKCCALAFHQNSAVIAAHEKSWFLSPLSAAEELTYIVRQNDLCKMSAIAILSAADYQLLRTKKPLVSESEMSTAILWQEQTKFSLPVEQLIVDYIDVPTLNGEKYIYVVAVAKRVVRECYQKLLSLVLQPVKITIPEFIYGHYIQRYYPAEKMVIWVNYFQDQAAAFAFYQGELIATLRLPKIETTTLSATYVNALNLFYFSEVKNFSTSPLWIINGLCTIDPTISSQITGKIEYQQSLVSDHSSIASHAYYGVLANE